MYAVNESAPFKPSLFLAPASIIVVAAPMEWPINIDSDALHLDVAHSLAAAMSMSLPR
jgi:hypothetical protein